MMEECAMQQRSAELAERIKRGDAEAMRELWGNVRRLAYVIVRQYKETARTDADDLMQCAFFGMVDAARAFDESRGSFNSVLPWYIQKECAEELGIRTTKREPICISLDAPLTDDEDGSTLHAVLEDDSLQPIAAGLEREQLCRDVRAAVDRLPDVDATVIRAKWFDGMSIQEIGDMLGLSKGQVMRAQTRAFHTLRRDRTLMEYEPEWGCRKGYSAIGTGLAAYRSTGMSCVERAVLYEG